jgi:hypothetical protein
MACGQRGRLVTRAAADRIDQGATHSRPPVAHSPDPRAYAPFQSLFLISVGLGFRRYELVCFRVRRRLFFYRASSRSATIRWTSCLLLEVWERCRGGRYRGLRARAAEAAAEALPAPTTDRQRVVFGRIQSLTTKASAQASASHRSASRTRRSPRSPHRWRRAGRRRLAENRWSPHQRVRAEDTRDAAGSL